MTSRLEHHALCASLGRSFRSRPKSAWRGDGVHSGWDGEALWCLNACFVLRFLELAVAVWNEGTGEGKLRGRGGSGGSRDGGEDRGSGFTAGWAEPARGADD